MSKITKQRAGIYLKDLAWAFLFLGIITLFNWDYVTLLDLFLFLTHMGLFMSIYNLAKEEELRE